MGSAHSQLKKCRLDFIKIHKTIKQLKWNRLKSFSSPLLFLHCLILQELMMIAQKQVNAMSGDKEHLQLKEEVPNLENKKRIVMKIVIVTSQKRRLQKDKTCTLKEHNLKVIVSKRMTQSSATKELIWIFRVTNQHVPKM